MKMNNISRAKIALNFYIKKAWEAAGLNWDGDNDGEVNAIVEDIVAGIKAEMLKGSDEKEGDADE